MKRIKAGRKLVLGMRWSRASWSRSGYKPTRYDYSLISLVLDWNGN